MARPVRVSADLVRMRAEEIRVAGIFRGKRVHHGSRPPAGCIAFTRAVSLRLGCSVSVVKRVLGGRDRSGPRRSARDRARSAAHELPVDQLRQALDELIQLVAKESSPAAESALAVFSNETLPMSDRLTPLLAFMTTKPAGGRHESQTTRAEATLWSPSTPVASKTPSKVIPVEKMVLDALSEALDASLGTRNVLGPRARQIAQELERELRAPQAGRN